MKSKWQWIMVIIWGVTAAALFGCDKNKIKWPEGLENKYSVSDLDPVTGKKMIHVEGSAYERGFAIGYEFPEETIRNCSKEYYIAVVRGMMGEWIDLFTDFDLLVEGIIAGVLELTKVHEKNIPAEFKDEMQGIVDGVNYARPDAKFKLDDILMLNLSIDVIQSLMGDVLASLGLNMEDLAPFLPHACQGFVATGNATADGGTLMGRHFMFPYEVFNETCLMIEYVPDRGYPFISITPPGYVGVTAAMNNQGLGIGQDMLMGAPTGYSKVGMGRLLLARNAIQYAGSLNEAVAMFQKADIADGNMFIVGDGKGNGAIVECNAKTVAVRYLDSIYESSSYTKTVHQEQIESKEDLVLVANHAVIPEIANESTGSEDSIIRYQELCGLLLNAYGSLDVSNARDIIDFLHPPSWYYGDDANQPVAASVNLFDLTRLRVWSLYGRYNDGWVFHQLNK